MNPNWAWIDNYSSDVSGRVIVGWDPMRFKILKLAETKQAIHTEATMCDPNISFFVTFVYASNDEIERTQVWDDLSSYVAGGVETWLAIGDFNNVLMSFARQGGEQRSPKGNQAVC